VEEWVVFFPLAVARIASWRSGVRTIVRQVEDVEVSPEFFSDL
jgi:hypothetical protein